VTAAAAALSGLSLLRPPCCHVPSSSNPDCSNSCWVLQLACLASTWGNS
jgi:hypothetical protein